MIENIPKDPRILYGVLAGGAATWLLNKLWAIGTSSHSKLIDSMEKLREAMMELKYEIKGAKEKIEMTLRDVDKLKEDVHAQHAKIRDLSTNKAH